MEAEQDQTLPIEMKVVRRIAEMTWRERARRAKIKTNIIRLLLIIF